MRRIWKIILLLLSIAALAVVCAVSWLFLYSRDLPDTNHLIDFAPTAEKHLVDACLIGPVLAVPFDQMSPSLRDAVAIAERSPDGDGALRSFFKGWSGNLRQTSHQRPGPSFVIASTLMCPPSRHLEQQLKEVRVAVQLDARFSRQQLFTIYLNRLYFGECGTGVENAAQCLFHKRAADLNPAESALVAGMAASPNRYSPSRHPDRALERRNSLLDAMVAAGKLSLAEAESSKSAPLLD